MIVMALLCGAAGHAAPRSEKAFAADMLRRLRTAMPGKSLTFDAVDPLAITIGRDGPPTLDRINLHNVYNACQHATAIECRRNKADFVSMVTHPMAPVTAAALRLVVRHADYVAAANAEVADDPDRRPVAERIGDDLYAVLASAGPMITMLVSRAMLVKLKLTPATAWARAARQTAAELPPIPTRAMMKGGGVGVEGVRLYRQSLAGPQGMGRSGESDQRRPVRHGRVR